MWAICSDEMPVDEDGDIQMSYRIDAI
jgi:hypothetical protein